MTIDANPIPFVTILAGEALEYKNKVLYVNPQEKIVMHGHCSSARNSDLTLQWYIRDMPGNIISMPDSAWLPLGTTSQDFVLLGGAGILASGESVSVLYNKVYFIHGF